MTTIAQLMRDLSSHLFRRGQHGRRPARRGGFRPRLESLESRLLPHANAVMDAEHLAVFGSRDPDSGAVTGGLLPDAAITVRSVKSGNWSDPAVWDTGALPHAGDNVLIAAGTIVTVDGREDRDSAGNRLPLHGIRDDGTLRFDPNADTRLLVDTILVSAGGDFEIGTADSRIAPNHTARVIFADLSMGLIGDDLTAYQNAQRAWDPLQFSHGLISHGTVSIYGSQVTSFVEVSAGLAAKANKITLPAIPAGWHVGDRLVITGNTATNSSNVNQDEEVAIAGFTGTTVTISAALKYNHSAGSAYVADVTRNADFESENPVTISQRGHVMFMHSDDVHIDAAGFYGLGRTDKRTLIDDPVLVPDTDHPGQMTTDVLAANINTIDPALGHRVLVPDVNAAGQPILNPDGTPKLEIARTGLNARGRYAVHFHRTGDDGMATISDCAVVDTPGWGIVNHSSDVDVSDNVVFNAVGAAYVTEAGDEQGVFRHNIAIHSLGSGKAIDSRTQVQDFGHEGDGYWLQGGNVSLVDNVASGQRHAGFVFFPVGLNQKGLGITTIDAADLADPSFADGMQNVPVGNVPLRAFTGNRAFGSGDGFESWFSLQNAKHDGVTLIKDFKVWNVGGTAIFTPYTNHITFQNVQIIGNLANPGGTGFNRNEATRNVVYDHVRVEGFGIGINVPVNGSNRIVGGTFNNLKSIYIATANTRDRAVAIDDAGPTDPIVYLDNLTTTVKNSLGVLVVTPREQFDVYLQSNFNPADQDLTRLFNRDVIRLGVVTHNGQQVYYLEQAADYVPFPSASAAAYVPADLLDKTHQQIFEQYGLAIGGTVAPASAAASDPHIRGLIGDPATYLPDLQLLSAKYFNYDGAGYKLAYKYFDAAQNKWITVKETGVTPLVNGWNLLRRTVLGQTRTLLVYGDNIPPSFVVSAKMPSVINQADIDNGALFVVEGDILDNSFGSRHFCQSFALNDASHVSAVKTRADGSRYLTISFTIKDFAGNAYLVSIDFSVTETATLIKDLGRLDLPTIAPSNTLVALLSRA